MLARLRRFITPPVFPDDPDKTAVARIVQVITLFVSGILIIIAPLLIILSGEIAPNLLWSVGSILGLMGIKYLAKKGYTNQASWLILGVLWLIGLFAFLTAGGVQAPGYVLWLIIVLLAGILLGWRVALGVTILNGIVGLLFLWMANQGVLPDSSLPDNDFRVWLFHTVAAVVMVMLLWAGFGSIREALTRSQYELRERRLSEDRFAKIFQSSPNALLISELESGIILDVNDSFERLSGFRKEVVIGSTATELGVYGDKRGRRVWVDEVNEHGYVHDLETLLRDKDGELRTCLLSVETIELESKPCTITFVQDITQRKQVEVEILKTRDDLRSREAQLRTILNNLPFWVWMKDVNSRFLLVNDLLAQTGPGIDTRDALVGKTDFDITTPELAQKYLDDDQKVMNTLVPLSMEEPILEQGEIKIYETYKAPFIDDAGLVLGTFGFARDITERKLAENALLESETRFRNVFEEAAIGMVLVSLNHDIVKSNRAFANMLGYSEEDLVGIFFKDITYGDDVDISLNYHNRLILGELPSYQFEKRYVHKQGHIVWALLSVSLVYSVEGQPSYAIAQVQDITDRKQAEADREMLIQELERRNAELERFAYTVSHDLKSPLVTIGGFLGFLEKAADIGDKEQLRADINSIWQATDKMRLLLDELLELSRIGRLMNPPVEVAFAEIVADALMVTQGQLMECEVELVSANDFPNVNGDRVRLVEVVQNLVDNAAKFSKDQPQPSIKIGVRQNESGPVFFVQDNGIGIPQKYHDEIFDIFNKLNPDVEGTGIGLALVKRIVEVHNGRLWVESDGLGQGSTFCFTLNETEPSES